MITVDDFTLYSPEEVSDMTRGKISPYTLKRLARSRKIECLRGERDKILFTKSHVTALIESWTQPCDSQPSTPAVGLAFAGTARSRKARGA